MSKVNEWQHLKLPLKEIEVATENFKSLIGQGGYGWVYKGKLLVSGKETMVAVKRLNEQFGQGLKEFLTEIQLLSGQHHPNLVSLVGYCDEGKEKTIVYEYAERGSLDQYIRRSKKSPYTTLTWLQRLKICVDAARGLDHLHSHVGGHRMIIHRDIKSSNILIDENWVGKISDLGLSKLSVTGLGMSVIVSMGCGTHGYCEPEYYATGVLTKKSDVYSFGVVLFEVLCGRLCLIDHDDGFSLSSISAKEYYKNNSLDMIIDHSLKEHIGSNSMTKFAEIAYRCLHIDREQRPTMDVVVKELQEALRFLAREMEKRREGEPGEADVIVPANWNEALEIITYGSLEQSIEGMKVVCREFEAISKDPEVHLVDDIITDADRLVSCLAAKFAKTFDIILIDASSKSCKYVLHTLMQAFQNKRFAHAVNQKTLDNLITEILLWLLDERVPRIDDGIQFLKALNVLTLKILDTAERTSSFVVLIGLLKPLDPSRWPSPPSNETKNMMFYELVVKCLIKITKVLQSTIHELDLDRILLSIHVYLQELGMEEIRRRAGTDDKPLHMVRTVIHELVKRRGTAIKGHLSMVPIDMEPQPMILGYIDLNLETLADARMLKPTSPTGQTHWGDSMANNPMPASHSEDAQLKQELAATGGSVPEDDRSVNVMPSRGGSIPVQSDFRQQHVDDQGNDNFQSAGVSNSGIDATRERMKSIQMRNC